MLTTKLGSALASRKALSIVVAALVVAGALAAQVISTSLELADKNRTIELQNQELEQQLAAIALQRQEVEAKTAQLEQLNSEIDVKSQEAESLGGELEARNIELEALETQAGKLQTEIGLLQSKIESDEQYISDLTRQLQVTQESARVVRISHYGLAVVEGKGVVFPIEVDIINSGTGAVSVDVRNSQYQADFQGAVRTASEVAAEYTDQSLSDKYIIVRFLIDNDDDLVTIDGSSAGALITAMMIAGLTDSELNGKVLVTGTIRPSGSIGTVGSVEEKTEAAMDFGANIMVVPESQEFDSDRIVVAGASDIDDVMRYLIAPD